MMFIDKFEVTDPEHLDILLAFFKHKHPNLFTPTAVHVYPRVKRGLNMLIMRYTLASGKALSYNILDANYAEFLEAVDTGNWEWVDQPNNNEVLENYLVNVQTPKGVVIERLYSRNVNQCSYTLPPELFNAIDAFPHTFDGLCPGDIAGLVERFQGLSDLIDKQLPQIKANIALIGADVNTVKDHDLYFGLCSDKEKHRVYPSLVKVEPLLPESGTANLVLEPVRMEDWKHLSSVGNNALVTIHTILNDLNTAIKAFFKACGTNTELLMHAEDLVHSVYVMLLQTGVWVYQFDYNAAKAQVETLANDILTRLGNYDGVVGLDINSWRAYDYTDPNEPVLITTLDFETEVFNRYTESFLQALYNYLIYLNNPLLRPYARKTVVATDAVGDHAIGSIRVEVKPD